MYSAKFLAFDFMRLFFFFLYEVKLFFQMFLFKEGTGQFYGEIIAGGHGFNIANSKVSFRKTRTNISV